MKYLIIRIQQLCKKWYCSQCWYTNTSGIECENCRASKDAYGEEL